MRLSVAQQRQIKQAVTEVCGGDVIVKVFGSRLDDNKKGGDIDLLIQLSDRVTQPALLCAQIQAKIMRKIGEQKIDVLLAAPDLPRLPVHDVAETEGVVL